MGSLFLVRHATTDASATGRNLGRASDDPLTAEGVQLAGRTGTAIAAELAALPHDEVRLLSSPAQRCRQTAAAIAGRLGLDEARIEIEPNLIEIDYGSWDGLTAEECRARDPELRAAWEADPYTVRVPGGESGADVERRARPVLDAVETWLEADRARAAVVVSHNHVVRLRLARALGLPLAMYRRRVQADPGAYSLITFTPDGPIVRRVNASPVPMAGQQLGR
ncbi:MAG TPA: histidine phosphatase family protein [Candidatus Limnocylindria bacterium]